jgi:putative inner membrane protein, SPFH/band 7 family
MYYLITSVVLILLALVLAYNIIKIVPQSEMWVVERLGRYNKTLQPGLSVLIPFIERVVNRVNMKEILIDIPQQDIISKDNASVSIDAVCFIRITDPYKATYQVDNLEYAIENLALVNIRNELGKMELDEILSSREVLNSAITNQIDDATNPWGVKVQRVDIKELEPARSIKETMEKQIKAEREKRAEILTAESIKKSKILQAEGENQSIILRAEAEKREAELRAEAREREAEAEARATKMLSEAIKNGEDKAINYFIAQKYTKALENIGSANNSKLVLMPLEASNLIGSIAGISQVVGGQMFSNENINKAVSGSGVLK